MALQKARAARLAGSCKGLHTCQCRWCLQGSAGHRGSACSKMQSDALTAFCPWQVRLQLMSSHNTHTRLLQHPADSLAASPNDHCNSAASYILRPARLPHTSFLNHVVQLWVSHRQHCVGCLSILCAQRQACQQIAIGWFSLCVGCIPADMCRATHTQAATESSHSTVAAACAGSCSHGLLSAAAVLVPVSPRAS